MELRQKLGLAVVASIGVAIFASGCGGPAAVSFSVEIEPGDSETLLVSSHCGFEWLEIDVNGITWRTHELGADAAGNLVEPAWGSSGETTLTLELVDANTLRVTAPESGVARTYHPETDPPGCI